ncbi:MAG TPA: cupin domain-containing protein [Candidatus Binatia bacterium]|nr:cupin domain-containing protein [Candidatus Binatia bacterium]
MKLERIPWSEPATPAEDALRERLARDGFDAFTWEDAAGADYRPHSHDHDESLWVLDGEITFGVAGTDYRLGPGDRLMLPAGTMHTARTGRDGARYLIGQRR